MHVPQIVENKIIILSSNKKRLFAHNNSKEMSVKLLKECRACKVVKRKESSKSC